MFFWPKFYFTFLIVSCNAIKGTKHGEFILGRQRAPTAQSGTITQGVKTGTPGPRREGSHVGFRIPSEGLG